MFAPLPRVERGAGGLAAVTAWSERPMLVGALIAGAGFAATVLAYDVPALAALAVVLDAVSWLIFAVLLVLQLRVAPHRLGLLRRRVLLVLIVASGPVAVVLTLTGVLHGMVLIARLLRIVPLGRWLLRRGSIAAAAGVGLIILLLASIGFSRIEDQSLGTSLYWAATTVTVGPMGANATETGTEFLTVVLGFIGLGFFGAVVGSLTAAILQREQAQAVVQEGEELQEAIAEAAGQAETDAAAIAARLDELIRKVDALEARLPPR